MILPLVWHAESPALRLRRRKAGYRTDVLLGIEKVSAKGVQSCSKLKLDRIRNDLGFDIAFECMTNRHMLQLARNPNGISDRRGIIAKHMQLIIKRSQILRHRSWVLISITIEQREQISAICSVRVGHTNAPRCENLPQLQCYPSSARSLRVLFFAPLVPGQYKRNNNRTYGTDGRPGSPIDRTGGTQQPALTQPVHPPHFQTSPRIGRHFAMRAKNHLAARPQGVK